MKTQETSGIDIQIRRAQDLVQKARDELARKIVGQRSMIDGLLTGILAGGHVLLEGVPGLAKTLTVKSLADVLDASFRRIQFTPDLLPADLIGTMIYRQQTGEFVPRKGRSFPMSFSPTRLTALRRRCKARCWRRWKSAR